eukprot:gene588-biopygen1615
MFGRPAWPPQPQGEQEGGAGMARAWRGRDAGYRLQFGMSGAGVARVWSGHGAGISCSPRPRALGCQGPWPRGSPLFNQILA